MKHLKRAVLRLASTYLAIIMVMSIGFSIIFYTASLHELNRRPTVTETITTQDGADNQQVHHNQIIENYLDSRTDESRLALFIDLVVINVLALVIGSLLSFLLAERTLRPIEENMEAQSQFVSDASHELRTPLTALRTANEVALRQKNLGATEARQVIEENVTDIARLQDLTNSMLGLLLESPTPETWRSVKFDEIVESSRKLVAAQAGFKKIRIVAKPTKFVVRVNEQQIIQLMTILLDNAVKYSDKKSEVVVSAIRQGRSIEVSVSDTGIGMTEDVASNIFTRFYRAEQSRTTPGYGLGLSIARKIADTHKAKLSVKTVLGEGSTFTFFLPVSNDNNR